MAGSPQLSLLHPAVDGQPEGGVVLCEGGGRAGQGVGRGGRGGAALLGGLEIKWYNRLQNSESDFLFFSVKFFKERKLKVDGSRFYD